MLLEKKLLLNYEQGPTTEVKGFLVELNREIWLVMKWLMYEENLNERERKEKDELFITNLRHTSKQSVLIFSLYSLMIVLNIWKFVAYDNICSEQKKPVRDKEKRKWLIWILNRTNEK